jgi:hypothetical protein
MTYARIACTSSAERIFSKDGMPPEIFVPPRTVVFGATGNGVDSPKLFARFRVVGRYITAHPYSEPALPMRTSTPAMHGAAVME